VSLRPTGGVLTRRGKTWNCNIHLGGLGQKPRDDKGIRKSNLKRGAVGGDANIKQKTDLQVEKRKDKKTRNTSCNINHNPNWNQGVRNTKRPPSKRRRRGVWRIKSGQKWEQRSVRLKTRGKSSIRSRERTNPGPYSLPDGNRGIGMNVREPKATRNPHRQTRCFQKGQFGGGGKMKQIRSTRTGHATLRKEQKGSKRTLSIKPSREKGIGNGTSKEK